VIVFYIIINYFSSVLPTVNLEIPEESAFSLEYWLNNGLNEDPPPHPHSKRRHQRERKEAQLIELFPNPGPGPTSFESVRNSSNSSPPDPIPTPCSKNSIGGINYNTEETSGYFSFKWFLKNSHLISPTVIFR
jgi:hypothetical protein